MEKLRKNIKLKDLKKIADKSLKVSNYYAVKIA